MSTETPTPRTDRAVHEYWMGGNWSLKFEDFARRLERERDQARKERDEARTEAAELRERVGWLRSIVAHVYNNGVGREFFPVNLIGCLDENFEDARKALAETEPKGEA